MGKKFFATMIVAVIAVCASYNIYQSQNINALSDLTLANVEALASGEWGGNDCRLDVATWMCVPWGLGPYCYCSI